MSFQFGSRCYGGSPSNPNQQQQQPMNMGMGGFGNQSYGYNSNPMGGMQQGQMMPMNMGMNSMQPTMSFGGASFGGNSFGGGQPQMMQQQQMGMGMNAPKVSILAPGQEPDPNMKVIKLNWGDLLGTASPNGQAPLKVAMMGPNGDLNAGQGQGLKVTFNGEVPQGMPCHVLNINPYGNILGGPQGR